MSASLPHDGVSRTARIAEIMLWTGAALFVLAAHVGAAMWLLRQEPIEAADAMPPIAIMIELAEEPEAVDTEENEISEDVEDVAAAPAEPVAAPETPPEEIVEERIVEREEPVEEEVAELPDAAVPLPRARPPVPEPEVVRREEPRQPEQRRQKPPPQQQQATPQATRRAQAQVRQSNRTAARQSASGVSSMTPARWQARLMAHLERRKKYPAEARRRGERGIVYVRFTIDDRGNVRSVSLARSSGHPALDNEVLSLVRRASPVPPPPPGVNRSITAPVRFNVR